MTANEDALVDLDRIESDVNDGWPPSIHDIRALIAELRSSRASIGPDSERAEQVIAAALDEYDGLDSMRHLAIILTKALRAAGLLPGPGDIVVSREALAWVDDHLRRTTRTPTAEKAAVMATIAAALSQPHPAQEQQT